MTGNDARFRWHRWFAWRPVRTEWGHVLWLECVERRGGFDHRKNSGHCPPPWRWEYRLTQDQGDSQ